MPDMMTMNSKSLIGLEKSLGRFKLALPIAEQQTMNRAAIGTMQQAKVIVKKRMTIRNRWTLGSIRAERQKGLFSSAEPARAGSMMEYMADQEFGGTAGKNGKEGRRMTTPYGSGEGLQARPRKRMARGKNKIRKIRLQNTKQRGKSKKQRAFIAIRQAAKSGRKFVFLDMPWTKGKKGIYKVIGGKKKPRIKMVHSLKKQRVVIPRRPWLMPAVEKIIPLIPRMYNSELKKQAQRHLPK